MRAEDEGRKKKTQKKGSSVPMQELGFKAKVYHGIETQYRRQRTRYKAAKYGAQNSKECFMGRLRFTVNVGELTSEELDALGSFKGIKRQEWLKVRHIVYYSKEELQCSICLEKRFQAPQMTSCGHVFCWHCILMHFYKSLKACFCPVCNQVYELDSTVSCLPLYAKTIKENDTAKVKLALKARREGDNRIYDPKSLEQDIEFARVVRATPERVLRSLQQERAQIEANIELCDDKEVKEYMEKAHSLSWQRIEKAEAVLAKKTHQPRHIHLRDGYYYSVLEERERSNLISFYQEHTGQLIFLHPICDKLLRKTKELPDQLEEELLYWEEAEYNADLMRKFKNIAHITINQEVDLLILNIDQHLDTTQTTEFREEFARFQDRKKEQMDREDRESERLSVKYEEHKEYMAKLKKMEESEFYDIRVPTTIDVTQLDSHAFFPSLIGPRPQLPQQELSPSTSRPKTPDKKPSTISEADFPELLIKKESAPLPENPTPELPTDLSSTKSETVAVTCWEKEGAEKGVEVVEKVGQGVEKGGEVLEKGGKGLKRRHKKQKFVNVTGMFFGQEEEGQN